MADDGSHGYQLWASDGSAAGTRMVKALNTVGAGADVQNLTVVNGTVFFTAYDSATGPGLYKSDGTAAGTKLVWAGFAENLTNVNGKVFFTTWDAANGERLWKTDGTTTTLVSVLGHPTADPPLGNNPTAVNGLLFFTWDDGTHGDELWRSDGTATGTFMVKDIFPGAVSSYPFSLTAFDGALYFVANDGVNNDAIWKSDGTAAGTVMVAAVQAGPDAIAGPSLIVTDLVAANGALFFTASDIIYSTFELGKTDGTAAGTVLLKDVDGTPLASVGGTLYFAVWAGSVGGTGGTGQLWKSDGTAAGTVMLAQLPGPAGGNASYPSSTATINGTLFFAVQGPNGPELWKSDGTARGTARVGTVAPAVDELGTPALANVGGTLYFVGRDSAHGRELWKTDGTAAGTALVQDINRGPGSSNPGGLVAVNGTLYFTADDGTHGQQLWALAGLTARGAAVKVQEGKKFSGLVATFTDPGSTAAAAGYTALITWGDGHTSAGTVTATGKGTYSVSGTNTYTHAGNYAISVTITRSGGGMVMAQGTTTVTDAPFWASRVFQRVKKGQSLAPVLGTLTDTNPFAVAGDFTLLIGWGDGQKSNGTLKANAQKTFDIAGTHTYSTTGSYTLTVTITEVGGQSVMVHPLIAVDA
jgi:ELWxxDGT repeat protein